MSTEKVIDTYIREWFWKPAPTALDILAYGSGIHNIFTNYIGFGVGREDLGILSEVVSWHANGRIHSLRNIVARQRGIPEI